jgi:MFS family permease
MLLGVAAGLIIAAETAALLWSAKLLDEMAPALAAIAGVGAAFFGLCNAAVRFPGDRLRSAAGDMPLMVASLVISIIGFAALGLSTNYALSIVSFAAVGFGLALLIPCIFALSARLVPANRAGALSFVSLLSAAPRILAPLAFGIAAAEFGTSLAFGLVAGGLLVALLLILAFARGRWA